MPSKGSRMQKFWAWLGLNLGKRAGVVSIVGLVITIVLGAGITRLEFATGQDSYLNKGEQVYKDSVAYQDLFGGQAMVTLVTLGEGQQLTDLFTPEAVEKWKQVEAEIKEQGGDQIFAVVTPLTALQFTNALVLPDSGNVTEGVAAQILLGATERDPTEEGQKARSASSIETLTRVNAIPPEDRVIGNEAWNDFLLHDNEGKIRKSLQPFFPNDSNAQMVVRLPGNLDIETEGKAAQLVQDATADLEFGDATLSTTGAAVLLRDLNDYLTGGMLVLGAIAVGLMVIILLVAFDVRWRLLPLGVVMVGCIWAFGLAGYLDIPLTVVTIAGLPVMLGVGIDYAIQMHARIEEEVVIDRAEHPIQETAKNLGPALLVVTFDAIFAFLALRFAKVPMIRDFGLLLAVGVGVICLCSIIGPLAALGIREYRSPTTGKDFREGKLGRLVVKLGDLPTKIAPFLIFGSLAVFVGGIIVEDDLVLQTDPIEWVNQDSQVIHDLDRLQAETSSSSELGVFVQSDNIFDDKTVGFVDSFAKEQLDKYPDELLTASSIVTTVSFLMEIPGAGDVPPLGSEVEAAYAVAPDDIKLSTANEDAGALNLIFRTGEGDLDSRAVVVRDVRDTVDPPAGVSATPSGLAVVGVGLLDNLEANRILLTYLAILFVFLFLTVRLRSIVRALLSMVPVLIAVGAASLVAFALDLKLSPLTAIGGPLVVAVCTEFTSLILLRFVEERRRGFAPKAAVDVTAGRTGRAFIVSAMTATAGVGVIATSSLPLLRDFGIIVALNVAVALLSALVFLPPMLVWADERNWVSRGLVPADVLERATAQHDTPQVTGPARHPHLPEADPA
jgi:hydrophobe/amphiphile efflux-3 (HAE3) family protein